MNLSDLFSLGNIVTSVITAIILGLGVLLIQAKIKMSAMHTRIKHLEDVRIKSLEDDFKIFTKQQNILLSDMSGMKQQVLNIESNTSKTRELLEQYLLKMNT